MFRQLVRQHLYKVHHARNQAPIKLKLTYILQGEAFVMQYFHEVSRIFVALEMFFYVFLLKWQEQPSEVLYKKRCS